MKCKKCDVNMQEGFGFDGKEWILIKEDLTGLEPMYDFFCRDCVEKVLYTLIDDKENKVK